MRLIAFVSEAACRLGPLSPAASGCVQPGSATSPHPVTPGDESVPEGGEDGPSGASLREVPVPKRVPKLLLPFL